MTRACYDLPVAGMGRGTLAIRVLIVDDHQIVRDGLRSLLLRHEDMEVVGETDNGRSALDLVRELRPDAVVIDIAMPELNGIEAARQITERHPGTRVIALSMHSDRRYVSEMLAAGASGYLLKDSAFEELTKAIRTALAGGVYLSPGVAGVVVEDYVGRLSGQSPLDETGARALSPREREVLQLIAEGKSTKEIASRLHLSVKTVETYRRQLMEKLGIYNLAGLVKFAIREGFADLDS